MKLDNSLCPKNAVSCDLTKKVPIAFSGDTIGKVENELIKQAKSFDTLDYVYVTDKAGILKGVASVKEILDMAGDKKARVDTVMKTNLITVHPHTHRERAVYLALKHDLKAIPVVEKDGRFLGIMPYDSILRVFNEEAHEDLIMFGGTFHKVGKEYLKADSSIKLMIRHRLPWIVVGVLGGAVAASIISGFELIIDKLLALAAFAPVMTYLSGAVVAQSETIAVRAIAINPTFSVKSYLFKELTVAFAISTICSFLLGMVALIGWGDMTLALIITSAMFLGIIAAVIISTSLPFIFRRAGWDPAFAAGPLATMLSDITTIVIFFTVAAAMLSSTSVV